MMAKRTKKFAIKRKTKTLKLKGDLEAGAVVVAAFQIMGVDTAGTKEQEKLIRQFGEDVLVSWNFTNEEGEDLPATGDGVVSLDNETFTGIVDVWIESLGGDKNLDSQPSEQETSV
jgi:hypothetical protein